MIGATQNSQSCPSAQSPTNNAWLVLRAGYNYMKNPITVENSSPTSGITEHGVGLGAGVWWEGWDFNLAYFHSFATKDNIDVSEGLADWNGTAFKSEQHWLYVQAGYQF